MTFMESPAMEVDVDERADEPITGVGMMQMQREQMQWMVDQQRKQDESQRRQEEWMLAQQEAQRHQEGGRIAVEEAHRAARTRKSMLQKFTDKDDIESYLDMFERVAAQQEWPRETWTTQMAGLLSGNALDSYSSLPSDRSRDYGYVKSAI